MQKFKENILHFLLGISILLLFIPTLIIIIQSSSSFDPLSLIFVIPFVVTSVVACLAIHFKKPLLNLINLILTILVSAAYMFMTGVMNGLGVFSDPLYDLFLVNIIYSCAMIGYIVYLVNNKKNKVESEITENQNK